MRLGYQDMTSGFVYEFKKVDTRKDLFSSNADYVRRFFEDVKGLGRVFIVRIKGGNIRRISKRSL
jgi:hypothetical protein